MTLRPDLESKKQSEKHLEALSSSPSFLSGLLGISLSDPDASVRQVSAVYFRRHLEKSWNSKGFVKQEILECLPQVLLQAPEETEKQLLLVLEYVLHQEETSMWGPVLAAYVAYIHDKSERTILTGLKIANRISVVFVDGYKTEEVLKKFLDETGQKIVSIAARGIEEKKYEISSLALKILAHTATGYIIPQVFHDPGFLETVAAAAEAGMRPESGHPSLIKWSFSLLNRLLKKTRKKTEIFRTLQQREILATFYARSANMLRICQVEQGLDKIQLECFEMLRNIVRVPQGFAGLKADVQPIVVQFILPAVSFNEEISELWNDSQISFLRNIESGYYYTSSSAASNLFIELLKGCSNDPEIILRVSNALLSAAAEYQTSPTEEKASLRYGVLVLVQKGMRHLYKQPGFCELVLTDLRASSPFLQYIAFSTFQTMCYYRNIPEGAVESFLAAVQSPHIAVVTSAVLCLSSFLEDPTVKRRLAGNVTDFLRLILDLSNKVQIDPLSTALEDVILLCKQESLSVAPGIAQALSNSVLQLLQEEEAEEEEAENEDRFSVIDGYIRTVVTLIDSLEMSPETILSVMGLIKPMIFAAIEKHTDLMPDIFPILISASYALKSVNGMMDILAAILRVDPEELSVYTIELSGVLDNYITYGKEQILEYLGPILDMLAQLAERTELGYDHPYVCRVLESIILNLTNLLGESLPLVLQRIFEAALGRKEAFDSPTVCVAAVEVALGALVLARDPALQLLRERKEVEYVLETVTKNQKHFARVHDLKLLLLFSGFQLMSEPEKLPLEFRPDFLLDIFYSSLKRLPDALEHRASLLATDGAYTENDQDNDDDSYYDRDYLEEDPSFETPLDTIEPFQFAASVLANSHGVISGIWPSVPENIKQEIGKILQAGQPAR